MNEKVLKTRDIADFTSYFQQFSEICSNFSSPQSNCNLESLLDRVITDFCFFTILVLFYFYNHKLYVKYCVENF